MNWTERERLLAIYQLAEGVRPHVKDRKALEKIDTIEKLCYLTGETLNANRARLEHDGVDFSKMDKGE